MKVISKKDNQSIQTILNLVIIVFLIFLMLYVFVIKNDKIAYVDSTKILNEYKGAIQAKKAYENKVKSWQANIDTLSKDVQNEIRKYEREVSALSPNERVLSKRLLDTKRKQLEDYQRAIQSNAREEDAKLYQGIVSQVNAFLLQYGKDNHYKIIFIANQSGTIAYASEGLDITAKVLEELNKDNLEN